MSSAFVVVNPCSHRSENIRASFFECTRLVWNEEPRWGALKQIDEGSDMAKDNPLLKAHRH